MRRVFPTCDIVFPLYGGHDGGLDSPISLSSRRPDCAHTLHIARRQFAAHLAARRRADGALLQDVGIGLVISWLPGTYAIRKLLGFPIKDIGTQAVERWTISPGNTITVRPAKMLPGQLDRICRTEFGTLEEVVRDFIGDFDSPQQPTMGYRLKNVTLIDGVLYGDKAVRHLRQRSSYLPARPAPPEEAHASMYETWRGNRWFGNWLFDDCLTYRLAEAEGMPVTSAPQDGHKPDYERLLDMRPKYMAAAHFNNLILFDDNSHNEGKRDRATALRKRLVNGGGQRHPGVFLIRGETGSRRVLVNERAIAEHLAAKRGFTILDPVKAPLDEIIRVCGSAQVIAGVEGSQLVHGIILMPPDARALVVQPPTRAVSVLKMITDRQEQDYSLVVGVKAKEEDFSADAEEIERTLDLN